MGSVSWISHPSCVSHNGTPAGAVEPNAQLFESTVNVLQILRTHFVGFHLRTQFWRVSTAPVMLWWKQILTTESNLSNHFVYRIDILHKNSAAITFNWKSPYVLCILRVSFPKLGGNIRNKDNFVSQVSSFKDWLKSQIFYII